MNWQNYISMDPKVMLGKPVIKGTRLTVELIVERLGQGQTTEELLISYPHINREAIMACLQYAARVLSNEVIYEIAA
ncbi:MAG: DUF433 domain-containing protein [Saprospiraceae bacterium]|nr:DUF433 domain-containing protein [Saprospiraceae bacterium]